ncbi:hypothetical protein C5167_031330 [Papaver somniferum]|uniref:Uncharacterized protein n=1 Tax=Papaver somniferum TaxID=3469 RepID=A0A4Y7K3X9_PAPSO|nr:hypothetical protein C5167_031330 [Papaver somniferum]
MQHSAGWFPLITSVLLSMKKRHILSNITKIYKSAVYGLLHGDFLKGNARKLATFSLVARILTWQIDVARRCGLMARRH